jgi:glycosyltransferase involved in cell wall biosynthesis
MQPLVSVIIPTYKRLPLLKEAVASVETQTFRDWELIIVDDGSDDGTEEFIRSKGYTFIRLTHSGLPGFVRNKGARAAHGTFLAFLDSDDLWKPEKCEKQIAFLTTYPHIILCHTREIWLRNNTIISQQRQKHKRSGNIFKDALKKCIIGPSTVMMRRESFLREGLFHERLEIAEDYELWLRITAHHEVGYIDEPLVVKRGGHPDQISQKYGHIEYFRIKALLIALKNNIFSKEQLKMAQKEFKRKCLIHARGCLKRGKIDEYTYYRRLAQSKDNNI